MKEKDNNILGELFQEHRLKLKQEDDGKTYREKIKKQCENTQSFDLQCAKDVQERTDALNMLLDETPCRETPLPESELLRICPVCKTRRILAIGKGWACNCEGKIAWTRFG